MILGFTETIDGRPTGFPGKILLNESVSPGFDYAHFSDQYREALMSGVRPKIHTLRKDNDKWKEGDPIHFAVNAGTPNEKCFAEGVCTGVQYVYMAIPLTKRLDWQLIVVLSDTKIKCEDVAQATMGPGTYHWLRGEKLLRFVQNDGFDNLQQFDEWFRPKLMETPNKEAAYALIHWTDYRYDRQADIDTNRRTFLADLDRKMQ